MNKKGTKKLNRKGFTLIELLGVIVILSIIGGIATYGVISAINTSKLKSEEIFIDKLSNLIDNYIKLNKPNNKSDSYTFIKCKNNDCSESYELTANKMLKSDGNSIYLSDLVTEGMITYKDLINPKNRKQCFDNITYNPEIKIYKDNEYVYYYYVDLSNNKCDIITENSSINTLPDNLKEQIS